MISMRLLPPGPSFAGVLAALHEGGFEEPWSSSSFATLLVLTNVFAFLAESRGAYDAAPVADGFILCRIAADECEILTVAVNKEVRRQGIGKSLLDAALRHGAERGAAAAFLEVACDNSAAIALYENAGFLAVGRRTAYYPRAKNNPPKDALVLRKSLIAHIIVKP